jgi:hypothetical protein
VATAASTFVAGYADGFTAVAAVAGLVAIVALLALPSVRPGAETPAAAH